MFSTTPWLGLRPVTGADYNQLSTAFFQNVNKALTGAKSEKDAVIQVETVAKRIVH
jgi:hypothetical protein